MSTATRPNRPEPGIPPVPVRRFSVKEYHKLIDLGIFDQEDRFELLEGRIVPKHFEPIEDESSWLDPGNPPLPIRKFSVDEYLRMVEAGVFGADERHELLEGWIVPKMTRNPPHDVAIELADNEIRPRLPVGWRLRVQSAITTIDSVPEPDLAVVRGHARDNKDRHPGLGDIVLLVEVSESTLRVDRAVKGELYARAGVPIYWIVNLVQRLVEVYTDPTGPDPSPCYRSRLDCADGDLVSFSIDGLEIGPIAVADLLP